MGAIFSLMPVRAVSLVLCLGKQAVPIPASLVCLAKESWD